MRELSLNILDLAQNSVRAGADKVYINISHSSQKGILTIEIMDNGHGMSEDFLKLAASPFTTGCADKKVGLGLPFFKQNAEITGGSFEIHSKIGVGTCVKGVFNTNSVNMLPLGDMGETFLCLMQMYPLRDFAYTHCCNEGSFTIDTLAIRELLPHIPIDNLDFCTFIREYIGENTKEIYTRSNNMKTIAELAKIRDALKASLDIRQESEGSIRIVVGMATCGIAAGARPVLNALCHEAALEGLKDLLITQCGCMGLCRLEPIVEVFMPGREKVTYVKMTAEKAQRIIKDHIANGQVVSEYTIGAME